MKRNFTKQDFYDLLRPNGECLEWTGYKTSKGYGQTHIRGKVIRTHRLALELEGINTSGFDVLHFCDNPACCNPKHLRVGTNFENKIDQIQKKRGGIKLSIDDVIEIKKRLSNKEFHKDIAKDYGVSISQISAINTNRKWKHV